MSQINFAIEGKAETENYINPLKLSRIEQTTLKEISKRRDVSGQHFYHDVIHESIFPLFASEVLKSLTFINIFCYLFAKCRS